MPPPELPEAPTLVANFAGNRLQVPCTRASEENADEKKTSSNHARLTLFVDLIHDLGPRH